MTRRSAWGWLALLTAAVWAGVVMLIVHVSKLMRP